MGRWGQTVGLNNSSGAASGVTATWDSANTWHTGSGTSTPDHKLMQGYLDATGQANLNGPPYHFFWNENKPEAFVMGLSLGLTAQARRATAWLYTPTVTRLKDGLASIWLHARRRK